MKMRKILPLVILAAGALFLLSGCDALLDAIFQNNQITVDVWVVASTHPDYAVGNSHVTTTLYDTNSGSTYTSSASWQSYDGYYVHYYMSFTKLPSDTFQITSVYYNYLNSATGSTNEIWDSSGTVNIGAPTVPNQITMPHPDYSSDSTGRSITVVQAM